MRSSELLRSWKPGEAERQAIRWWFQNVPEAMKYGEYGDFRVHRTYPNHNIPKAAVRIDVSVLLEDDHRLGVAAGEIVREIRELGILFDTIAGVPSGGTRLAEKAHELMKKFPPANVISVKKNESGGFELLGGIRPGSRVILIEDVMTTGESTKALLELLQAAECEIVAVVVLVDRGQFGRERLNPIPVRAVMTLEDIIPLDRREGVMKQERAMRARLQDVFAREI